MAPIHHTEMVLDTVRQKTDRVLLFYSAGKDSIVLLDLLAKKFDHVVCCFMYFVKDLEHINKYLTWSQQRYKNISFIQLPHYGLATIYKYGLYTTPNSNITAKTSLADIDEAARLKTGIDFSMYGWKQSDNLNRRLTLRNYELEAISTKTKKAYPLSHWSKKDVLSYIQMHKLPQPIQYGLGRSSGIGFNIDCLLYMRKHYPGDLKKVLTKFPLAERIIFEYDNKSPERKSCEAGKRKVPPIADSRNKQKPDKVCTVQPA
jgi:3'-phosphoadenosine 5'-phosphosulfate sulfotransferase (PAPS reductase)/FAD synthetase